MFNVGEVVSGVHFPESVEIKRCEAYGEYYIIEAIGRETNQYFELMIEKEKLNELEVLGGNEERTSIEPMDVQMYIQYLILQNESTYSRSRALGNKKLLPMPHQIEAVYSRMLQVPDIRFLLADDPGAGKTIMSGMLIKELMARHSVERILILVPPLVMKQWQEELDEKFYEHFHIINRSVLKEYGSKNPFVANDLCITSIYWGARDEIKPLIQEADFDLIIVDEAHKMAAYTHGTVKKKTSRTKLYQLGESILRKANHCLLLTATPHKGDMENFRHLMKLVDEDIFSNIAGNESLREKTNPFIIRRLKENLKNFDGTPLFPKRTVKTLQFILTEEELILYEAVTEYVREHFNRAISNGSNSTAFAMMLLQRRLSSSLDAIYLSLIRRKNRLIELYKKTELDRKKYIKKIKNLDAENYLEEQSDEQELIENILEQSIDVIDIKELKKEIVVLKRLIEQIEQIKLYSVEKKYQELEKTLFGENGLLLRQDEKIIIFTESVDTLNFLEKKLLERLPKIAKIVGQYSMDKRRKQVEMFRNECQVMLATDAGGESINLQFCNQMINYDIPWNPNKLEQRMGRIHRIGQRNEVFVFNLVAKNTREGNVMIRLLEKMEQMKEDLGSDLVYDFIGEVLEERFDSLADLMQESIINRESLDDIIASMEKGLSKEHEKLLKLMQEERLTEEFVDLNAMKREHNRLTVGRIPSRAYSDLTSYIMKKKKVRVYESNEGNVKRIERLPKFIRETIPALANYQGDTFRFTRYKEHETEDIELLNSDHPLFKLTLDLMKRENDKQNWGNYLISSNVPEPMTVEIFHINIVDGTGKDLEKRFIHVARRENGTMVTLDPYWIFSENFTEHLDELNSKLDTGFLEHVLKHSTNVRNSVLDKRKTQLDKLLSFLEKTFNYQHRDTLEKLEKYQQENIENRNSALINQMNAQLIDLDIKKEERLNTILRQKNISMKPPKRIISLQLVPIGSCKRVLAVDYEETIKMYEKDNGRMNVKMFDCLGLVDFYSERFNGEERYIILINDENYSLPEDYLEDLYEILDKVYIYIMKGDHVCKVRAMKDEMFLV